MDHARDDGQVLNLALPQARPDEGGLQAATAEVLRRRLNQQAAVAALGISALAGEQLDSILVQAVSAVVAGLGVEYAKVLELQPDGMSLLLRAGVGWRDGYVGQAIVAAGIDSQAGYTLRSVGPVIVEDLRVETRFGGPALLREHGAISGLSVVIHGQERPFGVLGAHATVSQKFGQDDVNFLQAVANIVAMAIERDRAEEVRACLDRELEARATAEAAEARYRPLFERAADPVIVTDGRGHFVEVNAAACELTGYTNDELLQMRLGEGHLVVDAEWAREEFDRLQREGVWTGELTVRCKDGRTVPIEARVVRVELPTGVVYRGTWRDISARQRLEQLRKELTARAVHELRNPLAAISASASSLRHVGRHDPDVVNDIILQADLLGRLVGDLADSELLEAGGLELQPRPTNIVALARAQARQTTQLSAIHAVRIDAPTGRLVGHWDRDRLAQVFQNLLVNAILYSPDGGEICLRVVDLGDEARVSISDQGPGIPARELSTLFTRFRRAAGKLTGRRRRPGLDLYVTRGIVEAHRGQIWVESEPDHGSTVTFSLPYRPVREAAEGSQLLTRRQLEIARLIAEGLSNGEIARRLGLADGTVPNHVRQIMLRLDVHTRARIASWAVEHGVSRPLGHA